MIDNWMGLQDTLVIVIYNSGYEKLLAINNSLIAIPLTSTYKGYHLSLYSFIVTRDEADIR